HARTSRAPSSDADSTVRSPTGKPVHPGTGGPAAAVFRSHAVSGESGRVLTRSRDADERESAAQSQQGNGGGQVARPTRPATRPPVRGQSRTGPAADSSPPY